ncbi:MAG TPA: hypothetical protein VFW33_09940, partial [Gemmataceae bacterium]|nr:hypothetical protein [Gemmataceae bacterium]
RVSNGQVAAIVLCGMAVMAVIGLVYALSTQAVRREYDFHLPKSKAISLPVYAVVPLVLYVIGLVAAWAWGWNRRESGAATTPPARRAWGLIGLSALVLLVVELAIVFIHGHTPRPAEPDVPPPAVMSVPPAELAALRYLPADSDFILAVHVAELLDDPVGRELLAHLGNESVNPQSLETWTGLKRDDMDHAVLGLSLDENLLVHFTIVVRTRRPIDQDRVLKALKAQGRRDLDGRPVYPFLMHTGVSFFPDLQANAWFADASTLVIAKRFDDGSRHVIPITPPPEPDRLQPELRKLLAERMGPGTRAWTAGHLPAPDKLSPLVRLLLTKRENEPLRKLQTFGIWITTDAEGVGLRGAFECADEEGAAALRAYLAPGNRKGVKEWLISADAGPMERAFAESMKIGQEGTWVQVTADAGVTTLRR